MTASLKLHLRALRDDQRGTSIIELAVALPIVSVLLLGLVDVSSCYSAQMSLQQAAARALERVQANHSGSNFSYVRSEAASAAGVPEAQVAVDNWLECNATRQASYTGTCPTGQSGARYVQVTINSSYAPFFPYSPIGTRGSDGKVVLSAASAVRVQ